MDAISASGCALVLVDYQARLIPAIHNGSHVVSTAVLLAKAAHALGIPVIGTEQNPAGLGPNVDSVRDTCALTLTKTHFDACADGLTKELDALTSDCRQVVVSGCEAHVCMMQTALGLLRAGKRVWVVENASGSRRPSDHTAAMRRLSEAGATVVTHEMVLFEWMDNCKHPRFKDVLGLIKAGG
ncbi:chloroperoxidase [Pandoraea iniqua]|uniref:Chloroperoxidase n=1 Tax=Pandoraea iniqua TaxID=2508288 RepID=A0A5E4Y0D9_9BURK|nr:isochorismatase family protein [Pandoraea iniqua]VVE41953.1 chloroperoxidase [Pandoraea iniqua]